MPHPDDQMLELVQRLTLGTLKGQLEWAETDRSGAYQTNVRNGSIVVATADDDGRQPYELQIISNTGAVVELIESRYRGGPWTIAMEELYTSARRKAGKVDELLRDLLAELPQLPSDEPPF